MTESTVPAGPTPAHMAGVRPNVVQGAVTSLGVLPLGVIAWVALWEAHFIASIVAFGVAWGAAELYRRGSGASITRAGAVVVLVVTVVTVVVSFFTGLVYDYARALGEYNHLSTWAAFTHDGFWTFFWSDFSDLLHDNATNIAFAVLFTALGAFRTLRGAFLESRSF